MYPHGSVYNKKIWKEVKGYNEKFFIRMITIFVKNFKQKKI